MINEEENLFREDDKPEVIKNRLQIYHKLTFPLLEYYKKKMLLYEIPGDGKLEDTLKEIRGILKW